jgi:hypothetical protein
MKKTVALLALFCASNTFAAKSYSYFRVGNQSDVATATTAGTVLMGGGTDVDAAFQWMCQRSGSGDFLVIRATGSDAYHPYIQQLCPSDNSVATLIIPNRTAASDPSRIAAGGTFDLGRWTGKGGVSYTVSANAGVLSSTQSGGGIY